GIDLGYWLSVGETMLLSAKNLTTLAVTAAEAAIGKTDTKETVFKAMSGSFTLTQGIAQNKDLTLYNDRFYTSGIGQINLPKQTLDYALRVSNAKKTANGYQATEPKIPLKVTGPLQQPHISIDPAGIQALLVQSLTSGLKTTVQTALPILNAPAAIIDGVTGNHSSNTNNNTSSSTTTNTDSATPTQNKPPPEQVIKDTLKGILGQ
ncbi:MAG TPA: AsmA-like C-terminal region-containing protein, partial [Gammaproteobacteria bacterium]|nr:AsmA-like C-terminal region-containing protein [Gammaproteobacteria bacterium]